MHICGHKHVKFHLLIIETYGRSIRSVASARAPPIVGILLANQREAALIFCKNYPAVDKEAE